jgi:C-terminal processing protease CtpA/Prc
MSATFSPPAFSPPRIDRVGLLLLVWWILFADLAGAAGLGLRIKDAADGGAEIIAVMAGSLAASAGLAPGDRILEAQGREIRQVADFTALVKNTKGAGSLELRVSRDGWRRTVQLATGQTTPTALDAESPSTAAPQKQAVKDPCGHGRLGIQIRDSATQTGVEIVEVEPDGAAAGTLRRGDLILAIEGQQISRVAALLTLIDATLPGQPLKFLVDRDQKKISLKLHTSALSEFECLLERGDLQLDASNWEEAGQLYSAALRLRPEHIAGWERMAQMLDKKGDLQGALTSEQLALTKVG